jgi:hypothetical protein
MIAQRDNHGLIGEQVGDLPDPNVNERSYDQDDE